MSAARFIRPLEETELVALHEHYERHTMRTSVHAAIGYAIIRPVLSIGSPDEQYTPKVETLHNHLATAKRGEVVMVFEDESDLHLHSNTSAINGACQTWHLARSL